MDIMHQASSHLIAGCKESVALPCGGLKLLLRILQRLLCRQDIHLCTTLCGSLCLQMHQGQSPPWMCRAVTVESADLVKMFERSPVLSGI
jgi:hypothetical protein